MASAFLILINKDNYESQEPKTGHWINGDCKGGNCSICGEYYAFYPESGDFNYCPNCGAKMVEPQETETWNGYHGQITAPNGTFERILNDADDDSDI